MKKKKGVPSPFAALTKDTRFAGTYEVLIPAEGRSKPLRVPLQFPTQEKAESWIHSPEGIETIEEMLSSQDK